MMLSRLRRFRLVVIAMAGAALLLHSQISEALVIRGDDLAYRNVGAAMSKYRNALWWDSQNGSAVDRICFHELLSHQPVLVRDAVKVANAYLERHGNDATVLTDRALALNFLRRYTEAAADFRMAASQTKNVQLMTFAGFAALHAGNRRMAKQLFTEATQLDSRFTPARRALARLS